MDLDYNAFGKRIAERRKQLHIKQRELADRLEISNNHLSGIETGRERFSIEILLRICAALDATPDFFLVGNTHLGDAPQGIIEALRLCSEEEIDVIRHLTHYFIERKMRPPSR